MDKTEIKVYEPKLGLDGTIPQLVDWANKYTSDYSNTALERISELAREYQLDEKYIEIPLLLRNERIYEKSKDSRAAYMRLQIDHYLGNPISLSKSNFGTPGTELEIREEGDKVLIAMYGTDNEGLWSASSAYSIKEFMDGASNWLDIAIGQTLYYAKEREE